MTSATIRLFLPRGDGKSLRTAEISNWTGKAIAAPRTEMDDLLQREELDKAGIYILTGADPASGSPRAYIGEAEVIRDRLKQHKAKEFWVSAIVFVSKDENLTKAHVRYLESRLLAEATQVGRFTLEQNQSGGSKLPESDREDMEVFLTHTSPAVASPRVRPAHPGRAALGEATIWRNSLLSHEGSGRAGASNARRVRGASRFDGCPTGATVGKEMAVHLGPARQVDRRRHPRPKGWLLSVHA